MPALLQTLATVEAYEPTKLAFEFLILTAARTSEVLGARWDEIDRDARLWVIPGTRTKADRAHRVPLAPRCLALLDRAAALSEGAPYVFPGRRPQRRLSVIALLRLLRRLTRERVVVHEFRASFHDWAARFPRAVCEAALAHAVRDPTEAAYFRSDLLDQRRALMEAWAAF
ncbi:MAG TPA: site-specific integrase, partial [Vicinamibacterales bacterium]|nr:site-specific integrase [Vicinamibacterales bacterium]